MFVFTELWKDILEIINEFDQVLLHNSDMGGCMSQKANVKQLSGQYGVWSDMHAF